MDQTMRKQTLNALRQAFERCKPSVMLNHNGYMESFRDNLLPDVDPNDFVYELRAGAGNELESKFKAVHSSSALVVNCFAPFRKRLSDLGLLGFRGAAKLEFERKCPTGLRRWPPHLDVVLSSGSKVIGIESKLTEYLTGKKAKFSKEYKQVIEYGQRNPSRRKRKLRGCKPSPVGFMRGIKCCRPSTEVSRRGLKTCKLNLREVKQGLKDYRPSLRGANRCQKYFKEMLRLQVKPHHYSHLDAAQLIKHAYGLSNTFRQANVELLYIYWEPENWQSYSIFKLHKKEVEEFSRRLKGSIPAFRAMSYPELWKKLPQSAPCWIRKHIGHLKKRYLIELRG